MAIKGGKTVVFESADQEKTWIFRSDGKCRLCTTEYVPELDLSDTIRIFDCKSGHSLREPKERAAKLFLLSSTNIQNYKQTERLVGNIKVIFPSLTEIEFERYSTRFGISSTQAEKIKEICGFGRIRTLRFNVEVNKQDVISAIEQFDIQKLSMYISSSNYPTPNVTNPAVVINAHVNFDDIEQVKKKRKR
jgi:hypothetical protein